MDRRCGPPSRCAAVVCRGGARLKIASRRAALRLSPDLSPCGLPPGLASRGHSPDAVPESSGPSPLLASPRPFGVHHPRPARASPRGPWPGGRCAVLPVRDTDHGRREGEKIRRAVAMRRFHRKPYSRRTDATGTGYEGLLHRAADHRRALVDGGHDQPPAAFATTKGVIRPRRHDGAVPPRGSPGRLRRGRREAWIVSGDER